MTSRHARLDRFLSQRLQLPLRQIQRLLAAGRVQVDGQTCRNRQQRVGPFTRVSVDDQLLQDRQRCYLMLNKPAAVVSATTDPQHTTVIDLLGNAAAADLHLAGRLDYHSTGLVLISNDGQWTRRLSDPRYGIGKRYRVVLEKPLAPGYVQAFSEGIWFAYEGLTTRPARLTPIAEREALVELYEGRYHQIKRMFGHFDNRVLSLHREAIGPLTLDPTLQPGQWRSLTEAESQLLAVSH